MEQFESFIGVNFWTALFTLLNFLAVYLVAKHYLIGPVIRLIHSRQKEIEDLYADAGSAKAEAQALQEEYQQKIDDAQAESQRIVQEAVARGQAREEEIVQQANIQAAAMLEKSRANIMQEKKKAINDAKDEISDLALAIAAKVVDRELNGADHGRLVSQFIDGLGDGA